MKNNIFFVASLATVTLLSACNSAPPVTDTTVSSVQSSLIDANIGQRTGMMQNQQDVQKFLDEANAASDKTEITKDQFTSEVQMLMQVQRAKMQQSDSARSRPARSFTGGIMRGPRTGSGRMMSALAAATKFIKYTDPTGNEVLLALDADGKVISKWPHTFGRGPNGMMGGNGMMRTQNNDATQAAGNTDSVPADDTGPVINGQQ